MKQNIGYILFVFLGLVLLTLWFFGWEYVNVGYEQIQGTIITVETKQESRRIENFTSLSYNLPQVKKIPRVLFKPIDDPLKADYWRPLEISECRPGLQTYSAPCVKEANPNSTLIEAYELVYPPFQSRVPIFVNDEQKAVWLKKAVPASGSRYYLSSDNNWVVYPSTYGQNMVFENVSFTNSIPDGWSDTSCMCGRVPHSEFLKPAARMDDADHESAVIAVSPDNWSWQHFLDRVTVIWAQSRLSIPNTYINDTVIITGSRRPTKNVDFLYKKMGVKDHIHARGNEIKMKRLTFSCRAPLIHPYNYRKIQELFGLTPAVPLEKRKTVVYFSRSIGDAANGGREVLNEEELLNSIKQLLEDRDQGEELIVFDRRKFGSMDDIMHFFEKNARALIGPHGSAFHNGRFCAQDTLVIEFMPKERFQTCFWEQSVMLGQRYFTLMEDSKGYLHDMEVNVDDIISILKDNLGKDVPVSDVVHLPYSWDVNTILGR
ncbi:hypothetical protein MP638_000249 [Amoeboaphelidium occidentale]|nr:hypothetical protein MP638_000249 [Amoeboaphelidium occidentale]